LEVYLVAGNVDGLAAGVYHYLPVEHALNRVSGGDKRSDLAEAALNQEWIADAPGVIVIAGVFSRTNVKYGERTTRYVYMEAGSAAQNVYLQAESLGLGTVFVGAFYELMVQSALELTEEEIPLVIMPVGSEAH
jgi:SagB-type dehydrogenase family enzyme